VQVDEGAEGEVVEVLINRRAPLRLGYVMVKNRSQRDVDQGIRLQQVPPSRTHSTLLTDTQHAVRNVLLRIRSRMCL
jgi:hypothetical protein